MLFYLFSTFIKIYIYINANFPPKLFIVMKNAEGWTLSKCRTLCVVKINKCIYSPLFQTLGIKVIISSNNTLNMLNTTSKVSVWNGILWNKTIIKSNLCLRLSYLPKNLFLYSWFWLLFFKNNSKMYLHFILKMIIINVLFIYICCMKIRRVV